MTQEFKVGDVVSVTSNGQTFTTYDQWATNNGLKQYKEGYVPINTSKGTVVAVAPHGSTTTYGMLVGVRDDQGREFIIGNKGLQLVSRVVEVEVKPAAYKKGDKLKIVSVLVASTDSLLEVL